MIREMQEEDNAEYLDIPFVSGVENEAGNVDDEKKSYPAYTPMDSHMIDHHITSHADN